MGNTHWGLFFFLTVRGVEWSSVTFSLTLSVRPPESFVQSDRRGLTQGGRDISSLSVPKGEFVMSENYISQVKRREPVVSHAFFIAGNVGRAVEVATVKT